VTVPGLGYDRPVDGIRARDVSKRFRSVQALDGVSFDVGRGEVVSLLGPNGAGKSTLLRILGTTVLADSGTVTVGGHDVVRDAAGARRSLGVMIGDERSHYWRLSGRRNLAFFAALAGMSRREAAARTQQLLEEVRLADAADRRVGEYSSGMRARLALARALLADPPLMLLDEPTRNLDPLSASHFRESTARLAREGRAGIIFATHNLHEAVAISTRILVLSAGRIVLEEQAHGMDADRLEAAFLSAVQSQADDDMPSDELAVRA
jgi:ABC-2 type transport system ATP-binding protein